MLKNKKLVAAVVIVVIAIVAWYMFAPASVSKDMISVVIKKEPFEIAVVTTGELEAKNSKNIDGPEGMRSMGIWQAKISDLVPEGTVVQKGGYIGDLDKTELATRIKDGENELTKTQSQYEQIRLDTTLTLRKTRDEIENLQYSVKEKQIVAEQSTYEPPATIRQVNLDLEKIQKSLEQSQKNYLITQKQSVAKMQEITASLNQTQDKLQKMKDLMQQFTILAPDNGMVIYKRDWDGKKINVGSTINGWDPTVATLPDLTTMLSRTYVNEVDIRKIKTGQLVEVSLDAFPEKKLTGKVTEVANVGEQSKKTDAKVFEVALLINEKDTTLRPAMTTSNKIIVGKIPNVISVPLDAVHSQNNVSYVFVKNGSIHKQEIKTGQSNDDRIIVTSGIKEGDEVVLSIPENAETISLNKLSK